MNGNLIDIVTIKFEKMRFLSIDDLFIKKKQVKYAYEKLDIYEKEVYKWYFFYQLCMVRWRNKEKIGIKDAFWDYLNGKASGELINSLYVDFCNFKDKNSQI